MAGCHSVLAFQNYVAQEPMEAQKGHRLCQENPVYLLRGLTPGSDFP